MDTETIIYIVCIAVWLVVKVIGKILNGAARDSQPVFSQPVEPVGDMYENIMRQIEIPEMQPEPEAAPKVQPVSRVEVKSKAKPLLEEEKPREKRKMDAKKLIIYSEIMNPKYKE